MQGFADRLDQYEHVTKLSQGFNCTRSLVQHKLTGMQFVLKRCIDAEGKGSLSTGNFDNERKVLQKT